MSGISLNRNGSLARLQLDRPAVLNALTPDLLLRLIDLCDELATSKDIQVVILEGAGRNFSAGADLPAFTERLQKDPENTADLGRRATRALAEVPQITIAALKGYCIGGGLLLAGACDMRIAADDSRFSIPEVDAGIPLSWGGMADVVRLFGQALANDLVLTCRPFDADEAISAGFISRIMPAEKFENAVTEIATQIAAKPSIVLRQTKRKLKAIRAGTFDARDDAAEMLAALNDEASAAFNRDYMRKNLGNA